MSFSTQEERLLNPATRFIEFKSEAGVFQYYDKEKKENIKLEYPLEFIVLDQLSTVKGYDDKSQSGIYSNEIKSMKEMLHVRSFKGGSIIKGLYPEIKETLKASDIRYVKSLYVMINGEIQNIQLKGAAFSEWLDYTKKTPLQQFKFIVKETEKRKKGKINYQVPKFECVMISKEEYEKAMELDKQLQKYLVQYQVKQNEEVHTELEQEVVKEEVKKEETKFDVPEIKYESEIKASDLPFALFLPFLLPTLFII